MYNNEAKLLGPPLCAAALVHTQTPQTTVVFTHVVLVIFCACERVPRTLKIGNLCPPQTPDRQSREVTQTVGLER